MGPERASVDESRVSLDQRGTGEDSLPCILSGLDSPNRDQRETLHPSVQKLEDFECTRFQRLS